VGIPRCSPFSPSLAPDPALLQEEAVESLLLSRTNQKPPSWRSSEGFATSAFEYSHTFGELSRFAGSCRFNGLPDYLRGCILGCLQRFFEDFFREVIAVADELLESLDFDSGHDYFPINIKSLRLAEDIDFALDPGLKTICEKTASS
jgi:hypothetical protein